MFKSKVKEVLQKAFYEYMQKHNEKRKEEQEWLYTYYNHSLNTDPSVASYLDKRLKVTFSDLQCEELQKIYLNITKLIINKLSVIYKNPAKRELVNEDGEVQKDPTEYYNSILPTKINTIDKNTLRYGKLYNTFISQNVYDDLTGKFDYLILPMHKFDVKANHYNTNITEVSFLKYFDDELYKVFWTETEHYRIKSDAFGVLQSSGKENLPKGDGTNPYGVVPFHYIRMDLSGDDFWGTGYVDVVNMNEQVNFLLTFFENDNILLGTSGTWVATNLGLDKKSKKEGSQNKLTFGVRKVIGVDEVSSDKVTPNLQHVSTNPQITEILDAIERLIKLQASNKGLNPNAVLGIIKDTSDFQSFMDFMGEMEVRLDDIDPCRSMEQMRFNITREINNALADKVEGLTKIDNKLRLKVDFVEPEIVLSPKERQEKRDWERQNNMSNPAQWMMEDNPDIKDINEATEKIKKNKELNAISKQAVGFRDIANNNLLNNEEEPDA